MEDQAKNPDPHVANDKSVRSHLDQISEDVNQILNDCRGKRERLAMLNSTLSGPRSEKLEEGEEGEHPAGKLNEIIYALNEIKHAQHGIEVEMSRLSESLGD